MNKTSTRATLLFDFQHCPHLTDPERARLRHRLSSRLSRDGRLTVSVQEHRSQSRNRVAAYDRLAELLEETLRVRKPRRPTRPSAGSRERRLRAKRQQSDKKRLRGRPAGGE